MIIHAKKKRQLNGKYKVDCIRFFLLVIFPSHKISLGTNMWTIMGDVPNNALRVSQVFYVNTCIFVCFSYCTILHLMCLWHSCTFVKVTISDKCTCYVLNVLWQSTLFLTIVISILGNPGVISLATSTPGTIS